MLPATLSLLVETYGLKASFAPQSQSHVVIIFEEDPNFYKR